MEPPVVALAEDGSVAVPLLGGHHGANALARALAEALGCVAAITTAGDLRLGVALDEVPPGWHIANPERIKPVAAALLAGEPVALVEEAARADWLHAGSVRWDEAAQRKILVTDRAFPAETEALVLHPPVLALGIGCERFCPAEEIAALARASLAEAGLAAGAVAAIVSIELKAGEPGIHALAEALGVPARFFPASRLLAETPRLTRRSEAAFRATGCWGVAEGAALAAAGPEGELVVPRRQSRRATCAVARAPAPIDAATVGRARGRLALIGIGPGDPAWRTPEASALIAAAEDIVGYRRYLDLLGRAIAGKRRHDSAIGAEEERARLALDLAAAGGCVALVSSGDPGIYGLAALVFELIDREARRDWAGGRDRRRTRRERDAGRRLAGRRPARARFLRDLAVRSVDPVGADPRPDRGGGARRFRHRAVQPALGAAAGAARRSRPDRARASPAGDAGVIARNLGRAGETQRILRLDELAGAAADMLSLVLIGSSQTGSSPARPRGFIRRAAISRTRRDDRAFHRRRAGRARFDHGARVAADRALPGLPLCRLAGAAGGRSPPPRRRRGSSTPRP